MRKQKIHTFNRVYLNAKGVHNIWQTGVRGIVATAGTASSVSARWNVEDVELFVGGTKLNAD